MLLKWNPITKSFLNWKPLKNEKKKIVSYAERYCQRDLFSIQVEPEGLSWF